MNKIELNCDPYKMPFTRKLFRLINRYKPGLEFQMMYATLIPFSASIIRGRGLMLVEPIGTGKGATIKGTTHLPESRYDSIETLFVGRITDIGFADIVKHLQSIAKDSGKEYDPAKTNFEIRIEDLSVACSKDYVLEPTMTTASLLVSDRALGICTDDIFRTFKDFITSVEGLTVKIRSMATVFGLTPEIRFRIKHKLQSYQTMVKDRETEYYPIKSRIQNRIIDQKVVNRLKRIGEEKNSDEIDDFQLREMIYKMIPKKKIPEETLPFADDIPEDLFEIILKDTYRKQHTKIRASKYLKGDLSALAFLNGSKVIQKRHLAFLMYYYPNIGCLHRMPMAMQTLIQTCNAYESIEEIADYFEETTAKIYEIINDYNSMYGSDKNPLEIDGDMITLKYDYLGYWLEKQQEFIQECLKGNGNGGENQ